MAVDVQNVLDGLGLQACAENTNGYMLFCPFHTNTHTPALSMNHEGAYLCFSCGEHGNILDFVMGVTNKDIMTAMRMIARSEYEEDVAQTINKMIERDDEFNDKIVYKLHRGLAPVGKKYFENRGLTLDTQQEFMLGYSNKMKMVTIPVQNQRGAYLGFIGRSIEGKRFKNSNGFKKTETLFNIHRNRFVDQLYVVESAIDAMLMHQAGLSAVATMGSSLSNKQIELIKRYSKDSTLIYDNDEAGEKMKEQFRLTIKGRYATVDTAKDVGELTSEELQTFIHNIER